MVSHVAKVEFRGRTNSAAWMSPYISSRQVYHDFQLSVVWAVFGYAPVSERRGGSSSLLRGYPRCLDTLQLVERYCMRVFVSSAFIALVELRHVEKKAEPRTKTRRLAGHSELAIGMARLG